MSLCRLGNIEAIEAQGTSKSCQGRGHVQVAEGKQVTVEPERGLDGTPQREHRLWKRAKGALFVEKNKGSTLHRKSKRSG